MAEHASVQPSLSGRGPHRAAGLGPARLAAVVAAWRKTMLDLANGARVPGWWPPLAMVLFPMHLAVTAMATGLRIEHIVLDGFFLFLALAGPRTRRFALAILPFWVVGVLYDNVRFLVHLRGDIHVADLYYAELRLFGLQTAQGLQTPAAWFMAHQTPILDVLCGFAYIIYVAEAPLLAIWLYLRGSPLANRLAWAFLFVNIAGIATYLLYPAAPPWYVEQYGLGPADLSAAASPAGAVRFGEITGWHYLDAFYSRSPNVFGAMPSLHVSYPTLTAAVIACLGPRWLIPAVLFAITVAFSAVYLGHHYVLDVIAGLVYGLGAYALVRVLEFVPARLRLPTTVAREEVAP